MDIVIAGAGIGGLTAALSLHAAGFNQVRVLEAARTSEPLGVGLNILPNAVRELHELQLLDTLSTKAVAPRELVFFNRYGQPIWQEARGRAAGHHWPQLSIHRGHLQSVLTDAVRARLGHHAITTDARVRGFTTTTGDRIRVQVTHTGSGNTHLDTDLLIGADGINSAVRHTLYPQEGPPRWNGMTMWRGIAWSTLFLTGASMAVSGDDVQRLVLYPIQHRPNAERPLLTNWVLATPTGRAEPQAERRGDWHRQANRNTILDHARDWRIDWLDIPGIINATPRILEYPMVDREPLARWSFSRVTLLGDAAHPMYPAGSNGATQAIIDARVLAYLLATLKDIEHALYAYDQQRHDAVAAIQRSNRAMGPERAITLAHQRAPGGFADIHDVIPADELAQISAEYAKTAGFDLEAANNGPSYNAHIADAVHNTAAPHT